MIDVMTIMPDGNPTMKEAQSYLEQCLEEKKLTELWPGSAAMGDGLTAFVNREYWTEIKKKLELMKYQVVEGP